MPNYTDCRTAAAAEQKYNRSAFVEQKAKCEAYKHRTLKIKKLRHAGIPAITNVILGIR